MTTPTEADRNARIEEIKGRAEKATPGPWKEVENRTHSIIDYPNSGHAYIGGVAQWSHCAKGPDKEQRQANAAFIAHAREDIPYLLAENARQAAELDRLKAELKSQATLRQEDIDAGQKSLRDLYAARDELDRLKAERVELVRFVRDPDNSLTTRGGYCAIKTPNELLEAFDRSRS